MKRNELIKTLHTTSNNFIEKLKDVISNNKDASDIDKELLSKILDIQSRSTGKSTRMVDNILQEAFTHPNEWIYINDINYESSCFWTKKIMRRIMLEHDIGDFEINFNVPRIRFIGAEKQNKCRNNQIMIAILNLYDEDDEIKGF